MVHRLPCLMGNPLARRLEFLESGGTGWHMQELELLSARVSGRAGASLCAAEPAQEELAAAQRRLEESSAEAQRLTAAAAACRDEVRLVVQRASVSSWSLSIICTQSSPVTWTCRPSGPDKARCNRSPPCSAVCRDATP